MRRRKIMFLRKIENCRRSGILAEGLNIEQIWNKYGIYLTFYGSSAWEPGWRFTERSTYRSCWGTPWGGGPVRIYARDPRKSNIKEKSKSTLPKRFVQVWNVSPVVFWHGYQIKSCAKWWFIARWKFSQRGRKVMILGKSWKVLRK